MRKKLIIGILSIFLFVALSQTVFAVSWWPLVPCGLNEPTAEEVAGGKEKLDSSYYQPCNQCDLLKLLKNLIDFTLIGLMPPVAAILFVWAGFLVLMGGASPGNISQGRTIFWNTSLGIVILSSSWLITNTIIRNLANDNVAPEWWKFECRVTTPGSDPGGDDGQENKYACQNSQCVESASGTYTEHTCNNSCAIGSPVEKYSCNSGNQCVADLNGSYTTNNCDNQCQAPIGGTQSITTTSLPGGTIGQTYSSTLTATGGTPPYNWAVWSGSLPAGLTLNRSTGTISGTSTIAGTSTFTILLKSQSTIQSTKQLSIVVAGAGTGASLSITTTSLANATVGQTYSATLAGTGGKTPYQWAVWSGSLPAGLTLNRSTGVISGTPTTAGTVNLTILLREDPATTKSSTKQLSIVVAGAGGGQAGAVCKQTGWNLCQARPMTCSASVCSQYIPAINQYASRRTSANLIKAVMIKESACNISADSGHAYGLMQLVPSTANIYKSFCGIKENITPTWLKTQANASASICIASIYLTSLSESKCGGPNGDSIRNIAAGYNGGSGACVNSVSCAGETSCDGSAVKKWECLYDNTAHTVCNDTRPNNYDETRDYATKVLFCYNNPGF